MPLHRHLLLAASLSLGLPVAALAGPDLTPKFNSTTGLVRVTNGGDAQAAAGFATVDCSAQGGGQCPDPAPADAAPYMNPAFPNKLAIAVPALNAGQHEAHGIAFFDALVFAPGTYVFTVCADAGAAVAEDNERNNCVKVKKSVRGAVSGSDRLTGNTATN